MASYSLKIVGINTDEDGDIEVFDKDEHPVACEGCAKQKTLYQVLLLRIHRVQDIRFDPQSHEPHLFCWGCMQTIAEETFAMELLEDAASEGLRRKLVMIETPTPAAPQQTPPYRWRRGHG